MKLQKIKNSSFFVVLPSQIVRAKGWQKGEKLEAKLDGTGDIVIKKEIKKLVR